MGEVNGSEGSSPEVIKDAEISSQPDLVPRSEFERVKKDLHKHKDTARLLQEQIENEKLNKQKEQNQWKEIAEAKEREALDAKKEAENVKNSFLGHQKYNAVKNACEKLGIRAEALGDLDMLDLGDVQVETTSTGKINILGSDKFAESLKLKKPHWFSEPKTSHVNTSGSRVVDSSGPVTIQMIREAEAEGRKSGNLSKYYEMHKRFQNQRVAGRS